MERDNLNLGYRTDGVCNDRKVGEQPQLTGNSLDCQGCVQRCCLAQSVEEVWRKDSESIQKDLIPKDAGTFLSG
ncbi:hypothetical protein HDU83_007159, partial [Entophlyctis luteolus]